jgi:acyl carrier protein
MTGSTYDELREICVRVFTLPSSEDAEDAAYRQIPGWDSVGHMRLVQEIEQQFGVLLDPEDVIDMESFVAVCEVLKKYDVHALP